MALQYHGSLSLGACIPIAVNLSAQAAIGLNGLIAELTAKLTGFLNVSAALSVTLPNVTAQIEASIKILAALQLSPPGVAVSLQLQAVLGVVAALQIQLGGLTAAVDLLAEIDALLGAVVHLYSYTGPTNNLGPSLTAATAGGLPGSGATAPCAAIVIAANTPTAAVAMSAVFGVGVNL
jgi:hypothetical protein